MSFRKAIYILLMTILLACAAPAQQNTTGGLKGKVKVESGSASNISVVVQQGEREVTTATTDSKGNFRIDNLEPGSYSLTFNKTGLSKGRLGDIQVVAGKVRDLGGKLVLAIDEGSLAYLRGSVFDHNGRSVRGAKVELARLAADGTAKKIDTRASNESGQFVFRLAPDVAKYRVTVKIDGAETALKDVEIDGAAIYRVAVSLTPAAKN